MQTPPSARPTGITILAILAAIGGVVSILAGIAAITIGTAVASAVGFLGGLVSLIGIVVLVLGIAEVAFAYGAWTLQPWAWTLGVAAEIVSLVLALIYVVDGYSFGSQIVSIALAVLILYYLDTPTVRGAFHRPTTSVVQNFQNRR